MNEMVTVTKRKTSAKKYKSKFKREFEAIPGYQNHFNFEMEFCPRSCISCTHLIIDFAD
jgi:hypothetical protein